MTKKPIKVLEDFTVEETAQTLNRNKISSVPVMDRNDKLVGIATQSDIFRVLISLTGIEEGGTQFAFQLEDKPGSIGKAVDSIREFGGRLVSILTSYELAVKGYRFVYIWAHGIKRDMLPRLTLTLREIGDLMYIIDNSENIRDIFYHDTK